MINPVKSFLTHGPQVWSIKFEVDCKNVIWQFNGYILSKR